MKTLFKKYLDIHSWGKRDKNGIFDVITSCSIFDKYIFSKSTFYGLVIEISISAKRCNLLFTSLKQVKSVRFL